MPKEDFIELTTVTDTDGVVKAVVTYKPKADGSKMFSVAFLRTFDDQGVERKTPWMSNRHLNAVLRLIPRVKEILQIEENKLKNG